MARVYTPVEQKPAENKRESGPKEKKGAATGEGKKKEEAGE